MRMRKAARSPGLKVSYCRGCRVPGALLSAFLTACIVAPVASPDQRAEVQSDQQESWRKRPPQPDRERPFNLPSFREVKLDNGLRLLLLEDHRTPMVTVGIGIPLGGADDPPGRPGFAEATAELMTQGAGARSSRDLARDVEALGARLEAGSNEDFTEVSVSVVSENLDPMIDILADLVLRPSFPEEEVALYKENRLQELAVQRQEPSFLAREYFNRVIYGVHPYAVSSPTVGSIASMTRQRIQSFYESSYSPGGACLVAAGDFDAARLEARLRAVFGGWKARVAAARRFPPMPAPAARRLCLIDRPGSEQADFRIGNLAVAHSDPDYFPLLVANAILGGGTSSRLFLNVREQKGYTYDVSSTMNAPRQRGTFFAASQTRTEVTAAAIKEILKEFDRLRNERVSDEELQSAKNYLNGVFSLVLPTQGGFSSQLLHSQMLGLGVDYLEKYRSRISAVTAQQVQQAALRYILTDRPAIVVVGDARKLKQDLALLGPTEVVTVKGRRIGRRAKAGVSGGSLVQVGSRRFQGCARLGPPLLAAATCLSTHCGQIE